MLRCQAYEWIVSLHYLWKKCVFYFLGCKDACTCLNTYVLSKFLKFYFFRENLSYWFLISVNNGQSEPDCNLVANVLFCNHNLAVSMFLDSMRKPYTACQCSQGELDASSFKLCMAQCPLPVVAGINARNSWVHISRNLCFVIFLCI